LRDKKTDAINAKISKSGNSEFFLPKSDDTFPVRELNTELLNFAKRACANCTRTRVDITRTSLRTDYERALTMKSPNLNTLKRKFAETKVKGCSSEGLVRAVTRTTVGLSSPKLG
jgi:hypothetical protein